MGFEGVREGKMITIAILGVIGFLIIGNSIRKQEKHEIKRFKENLFSL
jgi:hypothetical protein